MVIISSNKDKITESLELSIQKIKTCKSEFVDEKTWQKFKKKTLQKNDWIDLNDISNLYKKNMERNIYTVDEIKSHRTFGMYTTKQKAKKELEAISESIGRHTSYQIKIDKDIGLVMN